MLSTWTIQVRSEGDGPPAELRIRRFLKSLLRTARLKCISVVCDDRHAEQKPGLPYREREQQRPENSKYLGNWRH